MAERKGRGNPEKRDDFRTRMTNALIQSIEEDDGLPWKDAPWADMPTRPFNPKSHKVYRGGNVINLQLEQIRRDSDDPRWMTLPQANDAGLSIRKGAKAACVEYWDWSQVEQPKKTTEQKVDEAGNPLPDGDADEASQKRRPRVFYATVFNGKDIVGLPELHREITWKPNDLAEKLIAATGAEIEHTAISRAGVRGIVENSAYYSHSKDKMVVPPRESFKSESDYYATVIHELAHWTGHSSRLDRGAPDRESPADYAREELRAEIASMLLTKMLGVEGKIQNHAKYTAHYLEVLKGDKHEIFRAASAAEKIVDHIFEYAPELKEIVDSRMAVNAIADKVRKTPPSGVSPNAPNFIPPDAVIPVRTGRDDPRWAAFDKMVRDEATKYGLCKDAADQALGYIEPTFSAIMDAAAKNGHSVADMHDMLTRNLVAEMPRLDVRHQQWEQFSGLVRKTGAGLYPAERIEVALLEMGSRFQQLLAQAAQENWQKDQVDAKIQDLIYGDEGRHPITVEYVKAFIENSPADPVEKLGDDDDDVMITPFSLGDDVPRDSIMSDGEIAVRRNDRYATDDAEARPTP